MVDWVVSDVNRGQIFDTCTVLDFSLNDFSNGSYALTTVDAETGRCVCHTHPPPPTTTVILL